jgi:hypothetical protein
VERLDAWPKRDPIGFIYFNNDHEAARCETPVGWG